MRRVPPSRPKTKYLLDKQDFIKYAANSGVTRRSEMDLTTITILACGALMLILSIILLTGRGAFLLAGYNTKPKSEREKYDAPAMCRFWGKILLPCAVFVLLGSVEALHVTWFWVAGGAIIICLAAFGMIYSKMGKRFII